MSRILIVDDNEQSRYMLRSLLEGHGHQVITASNGVEALSRAEGDTPDVIVTDILMPEMDGFELCRRWKTDPLLRGTPFVFYTATYTDSKDEEFALSLGADRFVIKPEPPEKLLALIEETVAGSGRPDSSAPGTQASGAEEFERQHAASLARKLQKKVRDLESEIRERQRAEEQNAELEAQLRHAQKMEAIGRLAGGVAHDFNNIVTAIFGNAELTLNILRCSDPDPAVVRNGLEQIQLCAERAASLTRQLLIFSRRDTARPEVLDLNRLLTEFEPMLRRLIPEAISLEMVCASDLKRIYADAGQVEQVIMNLVVNARDAMRSGGSLTLRTSNVVVDDAYAGTHPEARVGPRVLLTVTDTGDGMSEATAVHALEPFFTTKPVGEGTGLGLATVYGIISKAGGHMTFDTAPGKGTTFKVYFPVSETQPDEGEVARDQLPVQGGTETILVCEDDEFVRQLTVQMLQEAGYTIVVAEGGEPALQLARTCTKPIDLLLTDVIMQGLNGRQLAEEMEALYPRLKTVFMSGYASDVLADMGALAHNVRILDKPFGRRDLLRCVRKTLDEPKRVTAPSDQAAGSQRTIGGATASDV